MITIKGSDEFAKMRTAGVVVARIHQELQEAARPGTTLLELDEIAAKIISDAGCTPSFLNYHGFPAYTCLSVNETIVHGIPDGRALEEGDILSVDAGAIFEGWHADAAITFGIGEITDEARTLIDVTQQAMWAGIEATTVGARLGDIGAAIEALAHPQGYGIVREYTGHGIGRQMHEEPQIPNYGRPRRGMRMKAGMAVCLEPMFNIGGDETRVLADNWSVVTADGSLSAHWEHTVAITPDGPRVLTLPE